MKRALGKACRAVLWAFVPLTLVGANGCDELWEDFFHALFQNHGVMVRGDLRAPAEEQTAALTALISRGRYRLGAAVALLDGHALVGTLDAAGPALLAPNVGQNLALQMSGATTADEPGAAVALTHDYAFVSAPLAESNGVASGAVYAFARPLSDGAVETQRLTDEGDPAEGDEFGRAVVAEGDELLVGAPGVDLLGDRSGAVYTFKYTDAWYANPRILPPDLSAGDEFGAAIARDGNRAVIGAPGASADGEAGGAAYVYVRLLGAWVQEARLVPFEPTADARFGCAVDVHGDTIVIGARAENGGHGAGYVFVRSESGWEQVDRITAQGGGAAGDEFGAAAAVFADRLVFGAPGADHQATSPPRVLTVDLGFADVFERAGDQWVLDQRLVPAFPRFEGARVGSALALDAGTLLVGAPGEGALYRRQLDVVTAKPATDPESTNAYVSLLAVEDDAAAGFELRRSVRGPFRGELTAGVLNGERSQAHDGAEFALRLQVVGSEPTEFHEIRASFVPGGLAVDALDEAGAIGSVIDFQGEAAVDFAVEQVGSELVLSARPTGRGLYEEVARVVLVDPLVALRPIIRVESLDEGAEIGFDDPLLTEGADPATVPPGETAQSLLYEAMLLQLDAEAALEVEAPEAPPEDDLTAAAARLAEALAQVRAARQEMRAAGAKRRELRRMRSALLRVRGARRKVLQAVRKIKRRARTPAVLRRIKIAYRLEGRALAALE